MRSGRVDLAELTGFDLQGKTIGVIGAGHIGLHVIRIARGFGMRVLAFDVRRDPFLADLLGFEYATMDRLLAESDIVTLHSPLTENTHHLLGRERIRAHEAGRHDCEHLARRADRYGRAGRRSRKRTSWAAPGWTSSKARN